MLTPPWQGGSCSQLSASLVRGGTAPGAYRSWGSHDKASYLVSFTPSDHQDPSTQLRPRSTQPSIHSASPSRLQCHLKYRSCTSKLPLPDLSSKVAKWKREHFCMFLREMYFTIMFPVIANFWKLPVLCSMLLFSFLVLSLSKTLRSYLS